MGNQGLIHRADASKWPECFETKKALTKGDEEHEVAAEREENAEPVAQKALAGAAAALGLVVPVVVVATTAGVLRVDGWQPATTGVALVVTTLGALLNLAGVEYRWHRG